MVPTHGGVRVNLAFATRALRARNYKLFFTGQSIFADRHVDDPHRHELLSTGSPDRPSCSVWWDLPAQIPVFVLGPVAGVWVTAGTGIAPSWSRKSLP